MKKRTELNQIALFMRRDVMKMAFASGSKGAHIGGGLSVIDILAVLYGDIMVYDPYQPYYDDRDRLILSKAHAAIGLYAALHYAGFLSDDDIDGAFVSGSSLYKHPKMEIKKGIEFSGGSLGQGLSLAVGSALALRNRQSKARVFVIVGDGEMDEGSIWEAAASVTHFNLKNITIILDKNGLQNDGTTEQVMKQGDLKKRFESLGFSVFDIDGHDVIALRNAFLVPTESPKVVIAETTKGKGVSFAENNYEWHIGYVTEELYNQAMMELDG